MERKIKCKNCKDIILPVWPRKEFKGNVYCVQCALKLYIITGKQYCEISRSKFVLITEKEEIIHFDRVPKSFLRGEFNLRNTFLNAYWKRSVIENSNNTCQNCGNSGIKLNAHHILPWKKFPESRYFLTNGVALCEKCHKEAHKVVKNALV